MSRVAHGHFGVSEKFLRCFHVFASFRYWYVDNLRVSWNRGMTKNVQIYQLRIYLHNSGNQSIRICNIYIPSKKTWTSLLFIIISKPEPLYITQTSFQWKYVETWISRLGVSNFLHSLLKLPKLRLQYRLPLRENRNSCTRFKENWVEESLSRCIFKFAACFINRSINILWGGPKWTEACRYSSFIS